MHKKIIIILATITIILSAVGCSRSSSLKEISETEETEDSIKNRSLEYKSDGTEQPEAVILNVDDFKETVKTTRPTFNASDYVTLPEGYRDITILDAAKSNVTYDDINERLEKDCKANGFEFTTASEITDEEAAVISRQKYQQKDDYTSSVIDQLATYSIWNYKENIFLNVISNIADKVEFNGFPEEVYEYDMSDEQMLLYGISEGIPYDTMCDIIDEKSDRYDEFVLERETDLMTEEVVMCMAEDLNIQEPSDYAYSVLMAKFGLYDYNDLYNHFTVNELIKELYTITVADRIVTMANVISYEEYMSEHSEDTSKINMDSDETYSEQSTEETNDAIKENNETEKKETDKATETAETEPAAEITAEDMQTEDASINSLLGDIEEIEN